MWYKLGAHRRGCRHTNHRQPSAQPITYSIACSDRAAHRVCSGVRTRWHDGNRDRNCDIQPYRHAESNHHTMAIADLQPIHCSDGGQRSPARWPHDHANADQRPPTRWPYDHADADDHPNANCNPDSHPHVHPDASTHRDRF